MANTTLRGSSFVVEIGPMVVDRENPSRRTLAREAASLLPDRTDLKLSIFVNRDTYFITHRRSYKGLSMGPLHRSCAIKAASAVRI